MKTKFFQKITFFLLALVLTIPFFNTTKIDAASKPKLSATEMTITRGSYGGKTSEYYDEKEDKYTLSIKNKKMMQLIHLNQVIKKLQQ